MVLPFHGNIAAPQQGLKGRSTASHKKDAVTNFSRYELPAGTKQLIDAFTSLKGRVFQILHHRNHLSLERLERRSQLQNSGSARPFKITKM